MNRRLQTTFLSITVGLGVLWVSAASHAQIALLTEGEGAVTEEGLHRVYPEVMEAAWVRPDFDLSGYRRVLLMPTAVQFRETHMGSNDARTRILTREFPVDDDRKEWLRERWREAVEERFSGNDTLEGYTGDVSSVLVVQGFLVDVVSRIPPVSPGSSYTFVSDPWSVVVVLEIRDAATAELLARTIDTRNAQGMVDEGSVWHETEGLISRWAGVLTERLDQLSELGGRPPATPSWWAPNE